MLKKLILTVFFTSSIFASEVDILCAANLKFFFQDIEKEYNKQSPNIKLNVHFGSSGDLYKQILAGKKYDIFLAANKSYPQKLFDKKKTTFEPKIYTKGSLILLIAKHKGLKSRRIQILKDESIHEITIANKKTAPYGMAAIEALKNAKLFDLVNDKLFYSTDASNIIGDVLWYGHAGILPKSAINFLPRGYNIEGENYIEISQDLYSPIEQYYILSNEGTKNSSAKDFMQFILGDGQKLFKENGYK